MAKIRVAGQEIQDGVPTPEQWKAWARTPGMRPGHRQGSSVPAVLAEAPEFAALQQVRNRLKESERRNAHAANAVDARNRKLLAEYESERQSAVLQGKEVPAPPELEVWNGIEYAMDFFDRYHAILESVERHLLRERADEWRELIRRKARAADTKRAKARQALNEAEALMVPFDTARRQLDDVAGVRAGGTGTNPRVEVGAETSTPEAGAMDPNPSQDVSGEPAGMSNRIVRERRVTTLEELGDRSEGSPLSFAEEALMQQRIRDNRPGRTSRR